MEKKIQELLEEAIEKKTNGLLKLDRLSNKLYSAVGPEAKVILTLRVAEAKEEFYKAYGAVEVLQKLLKSIG